MKNLYFCFYRNFTDKINRINYFFQKNELVIKKSNKM